MRGCSPSGCTGSAKGEFTLWRLPDFSYERLIQHHQLAVRGLVWSHSGQWLLSADDSGAVKYFESTLNPVETVAAHKERVNDVSFAPSDRKFATAAADNSMRIWDFETKQQERVEELKKKLREDTRVEVRFNSILIRF